MNKVRPKKFLGQHFLRDENIALKIVESLKYHNGYKILLEIGPGMGVLTKYLLKKQEASTYVAEIDRESIAYLKENYKELEPNIIEGDFLKMELQSRFGEPFGIIGNFPYNISSQIFFKVLEDRNTVPEVVCMLQKEVAQRIAAPPGNKTYGILSVLLKAFYDIDYLFTVPPHVFVPPPKVTSAVIRLTRNNRQELGCDEAQFFKVVKQGFQNRRKTLRNALKTLNLPPEISQLDLLDKRAEQLSVEDFIFLTNQIGGGGSWNSSSHRN